MRRSCFFLKEQKYLPLPESTTPDSSLTLESGSLKGENEWEWY